MKSLATAVLAVLLSLSMVAAEIEKLNAGATIPKGMTQAEEHECSRIIIRKAGEPNAAGRLEIRLTCEDA